MMIIVPGRILALGAVSALGVLAGILLTSGDQAGGFPADTSVPRELPPFEMTREVTSNRGVTVYYFSYKSKDSWKETVVSSTDQPDKVGSFQELRDGKHITFVKGQEVAADPPPGTTVPGPWFGTPEWFLRRTQAAGTTFSTRTRGREQTLEVVNGALTITYVFDVNTGIPLEYREAVSGRVGIESRTVSLVRTDNAEVLR